MRKLLAVGFLLIIPAVVEAQETYSLNATAGQVTDLTSVVVGANVDTCLRLGQGESCTQAEACEAASAAGGVSCTPAQARAANARLWPNTQAGREEFVTFFIVAPRFKDLRAAQNGRNRVRYCDIWWPAQTQTTKNAECSKLVQPAGCSVCPEPTIP